MHKVLALFVLTLLTGPPAYASGGGHEGGTLTALFLTVMLLCAAIGKRIEAFGQPAVLGELLAGVALGALALAPGAHGILELRDSPLIMFVAEIGVILLLLQVGLETNLEDMVKVGPRAATVAVIGVICPLAAGFLVGPMIAPSGGTAAWLFIGATLTATSVGITSRVFQDLGVSGTAVAAIILGAAVIDDVLGLVVLAVVDGFVRDGGSMEASAAAWLTLTILGKATAFLAVAIIVGRLTANKMGEILSRIHAGSGMKLAFVLVFCFSLAFSAEWVGLAAIIGAFAAGLVLDRVHFSHFHAPEWTARLRRWASEMPKDSRAHHEILHEADHGEDHHVEDLLQGVSRFFTPIFFIVTGMQVDVNALLHPHTLGIALAIALIAIATKLVAGLGAVGSGTSPLVVGIGMIPRGEVGLIFAALGRKLGVFDENLFSALVIAIMITTFVTPPALAIFLKKKAVASAHEAT
ncbi:cation:proton antiporter [Patescibacteria group bacterium]|nr:cation:proton antiporter [Patescibacteria group bacterium]